MRSLSARLGLAAALFFAVAGAAFAQSTNPCGQQTAGAAVPAGPTYAGVGCSFTQNGIPSYAKTYRVSTYAQPWASQSGDLIQIQGSASKTIRVTKIIVSGQATAGAFAGITLQRHSTADSGGTCTAQTGTSVGLVDSANTAPAATVSLCTAAATAGTSAGTVEVCRLFVGPVGTAATPDVCVFSYGVNDDQMLTLRGATDFIGLNTASFGSGGVVDVTFEWVEEP